MPYPISSPPTEPRHVVSKIPKATHRPQVHYNTTHNNNNNNITIESFQICVLLLHLLLLTIALQDYNLYNDDDDRRDLLTAVNHHRHPRNDNDRHQQRLVETKKNVIGIIPTAACDIHCSTFHPIHSL